MSAVASPSMHPPCIFSTAGFNPCDATCRPQEDHRWTQWCDLYLMQSGDEAPDPCPDEGLGELTIGDRQGVRCLSHAAD